MRLYESRDSEYSIGISDRHFSFFCKFFNLHKYKIKRRKQVVREPKQRVLLLRRQNGRRKNGL